MQQALFLVKSQSDSNVKENVSESCVSHRRQLLELEDPMEVRPPCSLPEQILSQLLETSSMVWSTMETL